MNGVTYWTGAGAPASTGRVRRRAFLLSVYDEYVNGFRDRSAIISPEHGRIIVGRGAAVSHVYVIDGQVLGTWARVLGKGRVDIVVEPFDRSLAADELAKVLAPAARELGEFLGVETALAVRGATGAINRRA